MSNVIRMERARKALALSELDAINGLPQRTQDILYRAALGESRKSIAELWDITPERAKKLELDAIAYLAERPL